MNKLDNLQAALTKFEERLEAARKSGEQDEDDLQGLQDDVEHALYNATEEILGAIDNLRHYEETISCPRCKGAGFDILTVIAENAELINLTPQDQERIQSLKDMVHWFFEQRERPDVKPIHDKLTDICALCQGKLRLPKDFKITLDQAIGGCWVHRMDIGSLRVRPTTPEIYTKPLVEAGYLARPEATKAAEMGFLWFTKKFIKEHMEEVPRSPISVNDVFYRLKRSGLPAPAAE